jgi:hypothetical protein
MSLEPIRILDHLRGTARLGRSACEWPTFEPSAREPLTLRNVEIHYVLMEMPMAEALRALLPALHPSVPAHLTVTFYRVPESLVGPFQFAVVGIGCRAGIRPRMLTTAAFASSEAAADLLRRRGHFPCGVADVAVRGTYYGLDSQIALGDDLLIDVSSFAFEPVLGGGAAVKFCAPLNPITYRGRNALLQVDMGFDYHETGRGQLELRQFSAAGLGLPGSTPEFVICGVRSLVDMEFYPDRALYDAEIQSEEGGMTILKGAEAA